LLAKDGSNEMAQALARLDAEHQHLDGLLQGLHTACPIVAKDIEAGIDCGRCSGEIAARCFQDFRLLLGKFVYGYRGHVRHENLVMTRLEGRRADAPVGECLRAHRAEHARQIDELHELLQHLQHKRRVDELSHVPEVLRGWLDTHRGNRFDGRLWTLLADEATPVPE